MVCLSSARLGKAPAYPNGPSYRLPRDAGYVPGCKEPAFPGWTVIYTETRTSFIFTAFYIVTKCKTAENPIHKMLLFLLILITSFVGLFSFLLQTASIWSIWPSHKITSSIKKFLVPSNACPRGYQLQWEGGVIKPFITFLVLYQCSATLRQFSPRDAVLCPLSRGTTQTRVLTKRAAELGSTISQYDTKYQEDKKAKCFNTGAFETSGYLPPSQRRIGMRAYKIEKLKLLLKMREKRPKETVGTFNTKLRETLIYFLFQLNS